MDRPPGQRLRRIVRCWAMWRLCLLSAAPVAGLAAQTVTLTGPSEATLLTVTPAVTVRASGFGAAAPYRVSLQASTTADFASVVLDTSFVSNDSVNAVQITRPLPSDANVYLRAIVELANGVRTLSTVFGPRRVPPWLTLVDPNSVNGNIFDVRRPLFVWRSAPVVAATRGWTYQLEITSQGRTELAASGIRDTVFRPPTNLQANTSYRWTLTATLGTGATIRLTNAASFLIIDPPLPTTTIFYQNFPNPFPSATAFATCFWFDIGEPGGQVAIDVLDVRGNFIRSIMNPADAAFSFPPGRYGRGAPGGGSNCDNRFVWDGTGSDGRTVAPGVYLLRFRVGKEPPIFRKALFRPR